MSIQILIEEIEQRVEIIENDKYIDEEESQ